MINKTIAKKSDQELRKGWCFRQKKKKKHLCKGKPSPYAENMCCEWVIRSSLYIVGILLFLSLRQRKPLPTFSRTEFYLLDNLV